MENKYGIMFWAEYLRHELYSYTGKWWYTLQKCARCWQQITDFSNANCSWVPKTTTKEETLWDKIIFTKDFAWYIKWDIYNRSGESINYIQLFRPANVNHTTSNIYKDMVQLLFKEWIVKNYTEEKTTLTKQEIAEKLWIRAEDLIIK